MHIYTNASAMALVTLLTLLIGALAINHSSAQTDFNIQGKQPQLEQEYQEELDKWMLRAYEGDRDSQFKVGVLFTNDQFSRPDFEQAVYWYKQAARQGHVLAQYNLGHQYLSGVGVEKNSIKAMDWWLQAAKQGHALAQFNIGRAYYLGIGLKEDQTQSRDWFERAAGNGEPKSIEILEQLGWAEKGQYTVQSAETSSIGKGLAAESTSANNTPVTEQAQSALVADKSPASKAVPESDSNETNKSPIAIYTDPAVRSVLIAIIDNRDELELVEKSETWSVVTSRVGFPVWVHGDYINVSDSHGVVKGDAVNARSVPIVTNGTIIGRLNRNEKVTVIDKRNEWFRVVAPTRFKAWVKGSDFNTTPEPTDIPRTDKASEDTKPQPVVENVEKPAVEKNDNAWLFSQSADSYTLQLASFDDPGKVSEFTSRAPFADNSKLHRFTARGKDITWTYFLYGQYDDKDKAEQAKQEIKQKRAWIRSFGRLQQNRCVAWKKQLPTPKELNTYCVE